MHWDAGHDIQEEKDRLPQTHFLSVPWIWSSRCQELTLPIRKGESSLPPCWSLWFKRSYQRTMAPHSSPLAWRIPGMGEPSGLLSMGSHRVGHDWRDLAAAAAAPENRLSPLLSTWTSDKGKRKRNRETLQKGAPFPVERQKMLLPHFMSGPMEAFSLWFSQEPQGRKGIISVFSCLRYASLLFLSVIKMVFILRVYITRIYYFKMTWCLILFGGESWHIIHKAVSHGCDIKISPQISLWSK